MPQAQITIEIDAKGNVKISTEGTIGPGCTSLHDTLVRALGGQQTAQELKQEYYQIPVPDFAEISEG